MPATFHGGPFHGVTVDVDLPTGLHGPHSDSQGLYRLDGGALTWEPAPLPDGPNVEHVRPEPLAEVARPARRQVTRR